MKLPNRIYCSIIAYAFLCVSIASAQVTFYFTSPIVRTDASSILTNFLKWLLGVSASIALVALILAGISYMTSAGDTEKARKAKKAVLWIIAGLILILLSYSILIIIDSIFA